jgi:hypothetical protein
VLVGSGYEGQGDIESAAKLYTEIHPQWAKYLPHMSARDLCTIIAKFFVRHRRYEDAKVYGPLREFFEANPPENASEFETLIQATAVTKLASSS